MRIKIAMAVFAVALLPGLSSCQKLFTTSLAESLARDPASLVPKVTAGNASDLADQTAGNADQSLVVLEGLDSVIAASTGTEKAELTALALGVASNASGVGASLMAEGSDLVNILKDGDLTDPAVKAQVYDLVDNALNGLGNLSDASTALQNILTDPSAVDMATLSASASAEDLAYAAIVILSANASASGDSSNYIDNLDPAGTLSASEQLAVDLATAAKNKYAAEGGSGFLADLLNTLNLSS